ncbi:MAG: chorismate synthase [Ruminococcaceae bacterium]|nr:chorismate synthase [Oscillospiraceae bacterium]
MKNTYGESVSITLFGESHGVAIGAILDGMAPGIPVNEAFIAEQMNKRKSIASLSTPRRETDRVQILSGVVNGYTTGTPITFLIENADTKSCDYSELSEIARPGHADYTAYCKYHGYADTRGGGHFSGRITAGLVAAGAIALTALQNKGIYIGTHISSCAGIHDRTFENIEKDIETLSHLPFAVLDDIQSKKMQESIQKARNEGDSVGGVLETAVIGFPAGVGEPWFDSLESVLSHAIFSVPAVKGVEFGDGFTLASLYGSQANDAFYMENQTVKTMTNHCGGILGGISNGMPILFRTAIKPTPSIFKEQNTINFKNNENTVLSLSGRHDPAIVHRARVVIDSVTALVLCDQLALRYGTDYLGD